MCVCVCVIRADKKAWTRPELSAKAGIVGMQGAREKERARLELLRFFGLFLCLKLIFLFFAQLFAIW